MDRLRKSFRNSFKKKDKGGGQSFDLSMNSSSVPDKVKCQLWQADDVTVRTGICFFTVKYLGCLEVFHSRGMDVCEKAFRTLKECKKNSIRAVLYISGDGLRVVDEQTRGLIVDQTVEKVSFCAPDREFERGFSYICRDGASQQWMCHSFMAKKESGERLCHSVGVAFTICVERKKKQQTECLLTLSFTESINNSGLNLLFADKTGCNRSSSSENPDLNRSENCGFDRKLSLRKASITERLLDPQILKPSRPPPIQTKVETPFAIARPQASNLMIQRQTSFKGLGKLQGQGGFGNLPFKRQLSLRLGDLPSTLERKKSSGYQQFSTFNPQSEQGLDEVTEEPDSFEIETMCRKISNDMAKMSTAYSNDDAKIPPTGDGEKDQQLPPVNRVLKACASTSRPLPPLPTYHQFQSTPCKQQPDTETNTNLPLTDHCGQSPVLTMFKAASTTPTTSTNNNKIWTAGSHVHYENLWELVPDQQSLKNAHLPGIPVGYLSPPAKSTNPFSPDIRAESVTQSPLQPQQMQSATTVVRSPPFQQQLTNDVAKDMFWNGTGDKLTPLFDLTNFSGPSSLQKRQSHSTSSENFEMSSVQKVLHPLEPSASLKNPFSSSMAGNTNRKLDSNQMKPALDNKRQIMASTNPFFGDGYDDEAESEVDGLQGSKAIGFTKEFEVNM